MNIKSRGRGALSNREGRFTRVTRERDFEESDDGEVADEAGNEPTELHVDTSRTVIARNSSPDVPFTQSVNPYRGCEHGCIYCYARTTHAYLDLSPGRDFETQIFYKPNARDLLRAELADPGYAVSPLALGTNTDPYQPVERRLEITRGILELLLELQHPVTIVTKGALILRDLDVLTALAARALVAVTVSLTTLDAELKRSMEPRTAGPKRRLQMIEDLARHGVPTGVLTAPIIPGLNDHELERMLELAAARGAQWAGYVLLRLPHEVEGLFVEWLDAHYPDRSRHVQSLLRQMRGGKLNEGRFHARRRGVGPFATLLRARFERARDRHGLNRPAVLNTGSFRAPQLSGSQLDLWQAERS
jgi:DNA repair photolyase